MNQENNIQFYQVILNLLNPFNYLFGCCESQRITFPGIGPKVYGESPFKLNATASSGRAVFYKSSNTSVGTITEYGGSSVRITGVGVSDITATQEGSGRYDPAPDVIRTLTVNKASQIITFPAIPSKIYGVSIPFDLGATSGSGLPITYTSSNESIATISGSIVTIKGAGTSTITASQVGNANYNAASDVDQILTVNTASQIIDFPAIPTKTYGNSPFDLGASSDSGLSITYTSSTNFVTISGSIVTIITPGTSAITASQSGNNNYNAASDVVQSLIVKFSQTITFSELPTKTYAGAAYTFTLSATSSSELPITYTSSNESIATISGSTVTIKGAGTLYITARQSGNNSYGEASEVVRELRIIID